MVSEQVKKKKKKQLKSKLQNLIDNMRNTRQQYGLSKGKDESLA